MARTQIAQPALFALQLGLVRCLAEDGLVADGVVGHSAGELAAAHCAGLFDLETILRIVSARSQEQGKTAGDGAMAAIGLGIDEAEALLHDFDGLVVAGDNGPAAVSLAGPEDSIDALVETLTTQGTFAKKLRLNYAFHSAAMDRIEAPFRALVADVQGVAGQCPFYSTVTGTTLSGETMNADYWWRNLREPVRFRPAIEQMLNDGYAVFVEIGPHPALLGYITGTTRRANRSCQAIETLRRGENEQVQRRKTIASAAVHGAHLDLSRVFPDPVPPLDLPGYPWQYERVFNHPRRRAPLVEASEKHALLGAKVSLAQDTWVNELALSRTPFIADHRVRGTVLFPATGFLEMAVAAGQTTRHATSHAKGKIEQIELHNLRIEKPLPLDDTREILLQTFFDQTDHSLSIQSRPIAVTKEGEETEPAPFTEHVRATLEHRPLVPRTIDLDGLRTSLSERYRSPEAHYRLGEARGLNYGQRFQTVVGQLLGDGEVLVELHRQAGECRAFTLDPTQILLAGADWPALLESAGFAQVARWSDAAEKPRATENGLEEGLKGNCPRASLLLGLNRAEQTEGSIPVAQAPEPVGWLFVGSDGARGVEALLRSRIEAGGGRVTRLDAAGSPTEVEARCAAFARETASAPPARVLVFAPKAEIADAAALNLETAVDRFAKHASL